MSRGLLFAALCTICLVVAVGYALLAAQRGRGGATATDHVAASAAGAPGARGQLMFRGTALGHSYGKVALAPLDAPDGPRSTTELECERVYYAAGQGLCLIADRGVFTTYRGLIFDADFRPRYSFDLSGLPSRARLSPDGRYAAMTVFVTGHSYASVGFSTRTTILDTASGAVLGDLEEFEVWHDGAVFQAADFNFWGVTFARDGTHFYATLGTGDKHYLIEGDLETRQARVLYDGVECPSLSPDGTRVAFKKQVGSGGRSAWQIDVLDLATLVETPLAETRSVDDQVEWLDDRQVLYALPDDVPPPTVVTNIWSVPADGSGTPHLVVAGGASPTVVR